MFTPQSNDKNHVQAQEQRTAFDARVAVGNHSTSFPALGVGRGINPRSVRLCKLRWRPPNQQRVQAFDHRCDSGFLDCPEQCSSRYGGQ